MPPLSLAVHVSIPSLLVISILLHLYIGTRIIPSLSGAVGATLFTLLLMASAARVRLVTAEPVSPAPARARA